MAAFHQEVRKKPDDGIAHLFAHRIKNKQEIPNLIRESDQPGLKLQIQTVFIIMKLTTRA